MGVKDVRKHFIAELESEAFTVDKTGQNTIELLGASFIADEPAIFGVPNDEYIVEGLLGKRLKSGTVEYRVKWKGFPLAEATWEPASALSCDDHVVAFERGSAVPASKSPAAKKPKGRGKHVKGRGEGRHFGRPRPVASCSW